jgi:adenine deaminase
MTAGSDGVLDPARPALVDAPGAPDPPGPGDPLAPGLPGMPGPLAPGGPTRPPPLTGRPLAEPPLAGPPLAGPPLAGPPLAGPPFAGLPFAGLDGLLPSPAEAGRLRRIAAGEEEADLVVRGGTVLLVHTGELVARDVAIGGRHIAALTAPGALPARRYLDARGRYVLPAYVDARFGFEAALVSPGELARLVLPRGTVTVVADTDGLVDACGPAGASLLTGSRTPLRVRAARSAGPPGPGLGLPRQPGSPSAVAAGAVAAGAAGAIAAAAAAVTAGPARPVPDPGPPPLASPSVTVDDLARRGHLDAAVRAAMAAGVPPVTAIARGSLAPARARGIDAAVGSLLPGHLADLQIVADLTLVDPPEFVVAGGRIAARSGTPLFDNHDPCPDWARETTMLPGGLHGGSFRPPAGAELAAISLKPGPELPRLRPAQPELGGAPDERACAVTVAVLRRGVQDGPRLGYLRGLGLERGAIGFTTAGAARDLVVIGVDDYDLLMAARALEGMGGGFVVVDRGWVRAACPLPIAGVLSDAPWEALLGELRGVDEALAALGRALPVPFPALRALGADLLVPTS